MNGPERSIVTVDERALLQRLSSLLDDEERLLAVRDADGLAAIADERERVTARLGDAARARFAARLGNVDETAALLVLYRTLRDRHAARGVAVQRHAERNALAIGVLAQASGQSNLYDARGRVPMHFGAA